MTIYAFMMLDLGLKGVVRDVFAAIFRFWYNAGMAPVEVPFNNLRKITGASRPAIANAIAKLEEKEFLSVQKSPGKRSKYNVHLSEPMLRDFEATFHQRTNKALSPVVASQPRALNDNGNPGYKTQNNNVVQGNIALDTGGLPEAL